MNALPKMSESELRAWMVAYLSQLLAVPAKEVDPDKSFELYGLDSSGAVGLSGDLEDLLGARFETSLVYDHPTINRLVAHLASERLLIQA